MASSFPAIPFAAGAISRAFLRYACKEVRVEGLPAFLEHLRGDRGLLTSEFARPIEGLQYADFSPLVANHVSV